MNRVLLTGVTLIALTAVAPAIAADLSAAPAYKAPPMVPAYNWTGFYVGANIGGSFGNADTSVALAGLAAGTSFNMDGVVGGGQIGYNWQNGPWVWGLEADFQGTSQSGSGSASQTVNIFVDPAVTGNLAYTEKLPWFGTVRGRLGFTPANRWLVYATGGLAYGEVDTNSTLTDSAPTITSVGNSFNNTRTGWTVGGGVEAALWGNWTGKLEYLYVDLGSVSNTFTGLGVFTPVTISSHVTDNIVRVGLNYRF